MKPQNTIQITQVDYNKLQALVSETGIQSPAEKSYCENLSKELVRAQIKAPEEISGDVITLYSRARLTDIETKDELELTIVLPNEVDVDSGRISILAPLGTAMLGYSKGDTFEWEMPAGKCRFRVDEILYQPEAVGKTE